MPVMATLAQVKRVDFIRQGVACRGSQDREQGDACATL